MSTCLPDLNSAITIANLQIADLSNDFTATQDLSAKSCISDRQAALIAYRSDLQHQALIREDRSSLLALAPGRVEAEIIHDVNSVLHEELASDLALIDNAGQFGPTKQCSQGDEASVQEAIKRLTELAQQSGSGSDIDALRTILAAAQLQPMRECVTCCEEKTEEETVKLQCDHIYCRSCVKKLFDAVLKNYKCYPAKCCQPITDMEAKHFVDSHVLARHRCIGIEMADPDCTYCHQVGCGTYLPESTETDGRYRKCPMCNLKTCKACKSAKHNGKCEDLKNAKTLQELAKREGWQYCPGCKILIERSAGCYHMTCRCGANFCYLCTKEWKTCDCAQFPGQEAAMREERARRGERCADDNHAFFYIHGPAECTRCRWYCDVFRGRCTTCGYGDICRKCAGVERFESGFEDD